MQKRRVCYTEQAARLKTFGKGCFMKLVGSKFEQSFIEKFFYFLIPSLVIFFGDLWRLVRVAMTFCSGAANGLHLNYLICRDSWQYLLVVVDLLLWFGVVIQLRKRHKKLFLPWVIIYIFYFSLVSFLIMGTPLLWIPTASF
jgi:hypothetical protein